MQAKLSNKVIKVYAMKTDGSEYGKTAFWNVRINGEVHQMYFARKWQAQRYLNKWEKHPAYAQEAQ